MDKELAESIGSIARKARKQKKLTQEDAAELIGVSAEFYARIERGHALPSIQTLTRISTALDVRADDLIGRTATGKPAGEAGREASKPLNDSPEIRRLIRKLHGASPATLRLLTLLIKELENQR